MSVDKLTSVVNIYAAHLEKFGMLMFALYPSKSCSYESTYTESVGFFLSSLFSMAITLK